MKLFISSFTLLFSSLSFAADEPFDSALINTPEPPSVSTSSNFIPSASLNLLAQSISSGNTEQCIATKLTVSGHYLDGKPLFVSAPVSEFSSALFKSSKKTSKLSPSQAHLIQRLIQHAQASQNHKISFTSSILDNIASQEGLFIEAETLCLQLKTIKAPRIQKPTP